MNAGLDKQSEQKSQNRNDITLALCNSNNNVSENQKALKLYTN